MFGPFFVEGAPRFANGDDIAVGAPRRAVLHGGARAHVDGKPIAGARLDVWQADEAGFYDVKYEDLDGARGRGYLENRTPMAASGSGRSSRRFYPIPADGPDGELLAAGGSGPCLFFFSFGS